jgi:hypothetical protein
VEIEEEAVPLVAVECMIGLQAVQVQKDKDLQVLLQLLAVKVAVAVVLLRQEILMAQAMVETARSVK